MLDYSFSDTHSGGMPMTVDEIRKELEHLSEEEKRLLLESLQSALKRKEERVSLRGLFSNTNITDADLKKVQSHWR